MKTVITPERAVILMQTPGCGEGEPCVACGRPSSGHHGLPTLNGDIVSNDWPGEWGGRECCEACYERHARGDMKTHDRRYQHLLDGVSFANGSGI